MLQNRRDIRGDEVLTVPEAQHERRRGLGSDQSIRLRFRQHDQGKRSTQFSDHRADGFEQMRRAPQTLFHQMRDQLGIRLRLELMPPLEQTFAQLDVILDNAIVNHRHRTGLMGMGVGLRGTTVRSPSGVADADVAAQRHFVKKSAQIVELADRAANRHVFARGERRDAGRIVAAILQPLESMQKDWRGIARSHVADYSAHLTISIGYFRLCRALARGCPACRRCHCAVHPGFSRCGCCDITNAPSGTSWRIVVPDAT